MAEKDVPVHELRAKLSYAPETGVIVWLTPPARNIRAGAIAGTAKAVHSGGKFYRYIKIGRDTPAQRVAWALYYGEWPKGKVFFRDGDPQNLRIENLTESNSVVGKFDHSTREGRTAYLREHRKQFGRSWKGWHLEKMFGLTLEQYAAMAEAQGSKCAICEKPETQMRGGKLKAMAVDHCHTSGKVRGLLCTACNQGIGKFGDDVTILERAIRYIKHHAGPAPVGDTK